MFVTNIKQCLGAHLKLSCPNQRNILRPCLDIHNEHSSACVLKHIQTRVCASVFLCPNTLKYDYKNQFRTKTFHFVTKLKKLIGSMLGTFHLLKGRRNSNFF